MNLNDYRKCFDLSYDQFIAQNKIAGGQINEDVRYQKIADVSRVDFHENQFFFFKDGKLRMIYISDDGVAKKIWNEFNGSIKINPPEKTVRSRAGKTSNQLIFARQGISASVLKEDVDFIEIYPPCSLDDYLKNIYEEPQRFIR